MDFGGSTFFYSTMITGDSLTGETRLTMSLIRFPAVWMRGGASKGLFVDPADLPADPARRDALLLRAIGSPDPYGAQMDGGRRHLQHQQGGAGVPFGPAGL